MYRVIKTLYWAFKPDFEDDFCIRNQIFHTIHFSLAVCQCFICRRASSYIHKNILYAEEHHHCSSEPQNLLHTVQLLELIKLVESCRCR